MKPIIILLLLSCSAIIFAGTVAKADTDKVIQQKVCPVLGGKINPSLYYEYKGQKIYVCCPGCINKIKANPEKYLKKVKADISKANVIKQKTCPVMGGKINKKLYYEYQGQKIYVCCPGCINKVKENPEKYLKKVKADIALQEKKAAVTHHSH